MQLKKIEFTAVLLLFALLTYGIFAENTREEIADKLIRLHVIANSNTDYDQQLKLSVRDTVLEIVTPLTENADNKSEVLFILQDNMQMIVNSAQQKVYDNGYDYDVSISLVNDYFPTKYYDDFALPAGVYDGLRINIGEAVGENWWCVVFPPVCTSVSMEDLDELSDEQILLTTSDEPVYQIKFKTVEVLSQAREFLGEIF